MKVIQSKTLQAYQRVLSFILTNAALLGTVSQLVAVSTLTTLVSALASSVSAQGAANTTKEGLTNQVRTFRAALIAAMRPIAAIVKDSVNAIPQLPTLRAPASNVSSGVLVGLADSMAEAAGPYQQTFITAGLAATFLTDLTTAAANLSAAITAQGTTKAQRVSATSSVSTSLKQARRQLDIIDPLVKTALAENTPMLVQWENIKRVSPKAPTSTPTVTPVVPAPAAATTATAAPKPETTTTQEVKVA